MTSSAQSIEARAVVVSGRAALHPVDIGREVPTVGANHGAPPARAVSKVRGGR
jgi:hypothetical protein